MAKESYLQQIKVGLEELSKNWDLTEFWKDIVSLDNQKESLEKRFQIVRDKYENVIKCFKHLTIIREALAWIEEIFARLDMKTEINCEGDFDKEMERIHVRAAFDRFGLFFIPICSGDLILLHTIFVLTVEFSCIIS